MNINGHTEISIYQKTVFLLPERAIYMPQTKTLVLADLHLGKATHFRKAGIMIPHRAGLSSDYLRLHSLINAYSPKRVLLLGDLFHSAVNHDWHYFVDFVNQYSTIDMVLVKGNHDIISTSLYEQAGLAIYQDHFQEDNFIYSHAPRETVLEDHVNIAGHIHPGCSIKSRGRQRIKLPCFHYQPPLFLLPAFGSLTGLYALPLSVNTQQYAIAGEKIFALTG